MEIEIHNLDRNLGISSENIINIVKNVIRTLALDMSSCHVIFINDEILRGMHEKYLNDPDFTDVMTFNLGDDAVEGEIYISYDRVKENAVVFDVSIENEIIRNMIHGLLHLKGYKDKNESDRIIMKKKEDELVNTCAKTGN
jgi:probable rRNA maturation factor